MREYNKKKERNQVVAKFAEGYVSQNMAELVKNCANWIVFLEDESRDIRKWLRANSCKWRFCPMCAMRKSLRDALRIAVIMAWIEDEYKKAFIMGTFTVPNVTAEELRDKIAEMNKGWDRLKRRPAFVEHVGNDCMRKLEITRDGERNITPAMWNGTGKHKDKPREEYFTRQGLSIGDANPNYDTYHPHFHAVFAVKKHYFTSRDYVKQADWLTHWQGCMCDPSITQVDVRRVKEGDVREFTKYAAKDSDYTVDKRIFDTFYHALKGRQHQTFSGLFAEGNKKYKAGELDKYITPDKTEYMYEVFYNWLGNKYNIKTLRRLNPQQDWDLLKRGITI